MISLAKRKRAIFIVLGFLLFLNILAWIAVYDLSQSRFLEVNFFDVGQGDAIFIETPKFQQILIDGGPDKTILKKLAIEMPFWDRTIDLIILTHPHYDHLAGLIEVLKRYKVDYILWTGVVRDTPEFKEWSKVIEKGRFQTKIAKAGQKVKISEKDFLTILYPFENLQDQEFKNINNTSIVARLVFGENSFLFTGDIYKSVEKELLSRGGEINSNVLKVSHHGSKTSSAEEFIEKVSPEIAVISVGKENRYGYPHKATLEVLESYDIKILRTDKDGDIKIISNRKSLKIK